MISFETHDSYYSQKNNCLFTVMLNDKKYIITQNKAYHTNPSEFPPFVEMLQKVCDEDVLSIYGLDNHIAALYEKYQSAPFEVEYALQHRVSHLHAYFERSQGEVEEKIKTLPSMLKETYRINALRAIEIKAKQWYIMDEYRAAEECELHY